MADAVEGWVSPSGDYLHNPDVFTRCHMMGTCSHITMEAHAAELPRCSFCAQPPLRNENQVSLEGMDHLGVTWCLQSG